MNKGECDSGESDESGRGEISGAVFNNDIVEVHHEDAENDRHEGCVEVAIFEVFFGDVVHFFHFVGILNILFDAVGVANE